MTDRALRSLVSDDEGDVTAHAGDSVETERRRVGEELEALVDRWRAGR